MNGASTVRYRFGGDLIGPNDAGYDMARKVFNGMVDPPAGGYRALHQRRRRRGCHKAGARQSARAAAPAFRNAATD